MNSKARGSVAAVRRPALATLHAALGSCSEGPARRCRDIRYRRVATMNLRFLSRKVP